MMGMFAMGNTSSMKVLVWSTVFLIWGDTTSMRVRYLYVNVLYHSVIPIAKCIKFVHHECITVQLMGKPILLFTGMRMFFLLEIWSLLLLHIRLISVVSGFTKLVHLKAKTSKSLLWSIKPNYPSV